jgi:ADP-heptose:LPS heptosyltransferase
MSEHFKLNINFKNFKNEFFFSKHELLKFKKDLDLPEKFSLIQSISKTSFTKNKEWKHEGMQSIVDYFSQINWIQIGLSTEPKLNNCIYKLDLDLRSLAFVISKCNFLVTYEGLFNHLASCFEKKTFLIHTGFLPVEAFNYRNNIIIEKNSNMECFPCFDLDCKSHHENCVKNLSDDFVIKSISQNI